MAGFRVRTERRGAGGHYLWVLEGDGGDAAEVCPGLGFNCFRWRAGGHEALFATPTFLDGDRPTRSGVPVLFPFPNRIRDGRFSWDGREYRLPLNDPSGKNAIHGFACRRPWRVIDQGADEGSAWVTGEFQCSRDDPDSLALWPADHRIRLTCRLSAGALRHEAVVVNPDRVPLPFGMGYHHYLRPPGGAEALVSVPAEQFWVLKESLPTGQRLPVGERRDLRAPRRFSELELDDVLTALPGSAGADGLAERGRVVGPDATALLLRASPDFREVVAFTPPHREAIALEPYTCTTDAVNLQARGVDAGLRVLAPGERWQGTVEVRLVRGEAAR